MLLKDHSLAGSYNSGAFFVMVDRDEFHQTYRYTAYIVRQSDKSFVAISTAALALNLMANSHRSIAYGAHLRWFTERRKPLANLPADLLNHYNVIYHKSTSDGQVRSIADAVQACLPTTDKIAVDLSGKLMLHLDVAINIKSCAGQSPEDLIKKIDDALTKLSDAKRAMLAVQNVMKSTSPLVFSDNLRI